MIGEPMVTKGVVMWNEDADLELGDGHSLRWFQWSPDRDIPSNAERYAGVPDVPKAGCTIRHPHKVTGEPCMGACWFDLPGTRSIPGNERSHFWQVESWEPLTLSPSILCSCGDHGFIRNGKWVSA
jgi:hypothetical protein